MGGFDTEPFDAAPFDAAPAASGTTAPAPTGSDFVPRPPRLVTLPVAPAEYCFVGLREVLKSDEALAAAGVTVRAWDGDPTESWVPNEGDLPLVRITPSGGLANWVNEGQHQTTLQVPITSFIPGVNAVDVLRISAAVFAAVFPQDPTRRQQVNAMLQGRSGIYDAIGPRVELVGCAMRQMGFKPMPQGALPYCLQVDSVLELKIMVPS